MNVAESILKSFVKKSHDQSYSKRGETLVFHEKFRHKNNQLVLDSVKPTEEMKEMQDWFMMKSSKMDMMWKKRFLKLQNYKLCIYKKEDDEESMVKEFYIFAVGIHGGRTKSEEFFFSIKDGSKVLAFKGVSSKSECQKTMKKWGETLTRLNNYWRMVYLFFYLILLLFINLFYISCINTLSIMLLILYLMIIKKCWMNDIKRK